MGRSEKWSRSSWSGESIWPAFVDRAVIASTECGHPVPCATSYQQESFLFSPPDAPVLSIPASNICWLAFQRNGKCDFISLETDDFATAIVRAEEIREQPAPQPGDGPETGINRFFTPQATAERVHALLLERIEVNGRVGAKESGSSRITGHPTPPGASVRSRLAGCVDFCVGLRRSPGRDRRGYRRSAHALANTKSYSTVTPCLLFGQFLRAERCARYAPPVGSCHLFFVLIDFQRVVSDRSIYSGSNLPHES